MKTIDSQIRAEMHRSDMRARRIRQRKRMGSARAAPEEAGWFKNLTTSLMKRWKAGK